MNRRTSGAYHALRPSSEGGWRASSYPNSASLPVQSGRTATTFDRPSPSQAPSFNAICVLPDPERPVTIAKRFVARLATKDRTTRECTEPKDRWHCSSACEKDSTTAAKSLLGDTRSRAGLGVLSVTIRSLTRLSRALP